MTKFFAALEQAERDRALRAQVHRAAAGPARLIPDRSPMPAPPVMAEAPESIDEHLVSLLKPTSGEAEQYRALRHVVERARAASGLQLVGVSSAAARDGKTLTAINLAGALAQAPGMSVLLIDMDLRHPVVASQLALQDISIGVAEAILNPELALHDVVYRCATFNLSVLPARRSLNATYELLDSERCKELIEAARRKFDYVVIDLPPLVPVPDCRLVQKWIDAFLVVVAAHKTPRKLLASALSTLTPEKVLGLVFNGDGRAVAGYAYGPPTRRRRAAGSEVSETETRPPSSTH